MIVVYFRVMAPHFMLQRGIWVSSPNKEINPIPFRWHAELPGPGNMAQTNTHVSPESLVSWGKRAASDGTLPCFSLLPSPTATRHGGEAEKRRGKKKLKRAWKRGASERSIKEGRREGLDKMNYAKLSETAIVGGAGCVKGIQRWSAAAPLSLLPTAASRLIRAPANGQ